MSFAFTKMHGLGNDFVVLDGRTRALPLDAALARQIADRHRGVGCDQILLLAPAADAGALAELRIWNQDGSRAEQCGNGLRCVAAWLVRAGAFALGTEGNIVVGGQTLRVRVHALTAIAAEVEAEMGEPQFGAAAVGLRDSVALPESGLPAPTLLALGNPHAVLEVDDPHSDACTALGPRLSAHAAFAAGINAGFVKRHDATHLRLRVHERGAGWTAACGSGACAAMAALRSVGRVDACVEVQQAGGTVQVRWAGPGQALWLRGPASFVFEGVWPRP